MSATFLSYLLRKVQRLTLAEGQAVHALVDLVRQAGGKVAGIGIAVEKGYQKGGALLREEGYRLESIAIIEEMDWQTKTIRFREQHD